MKCYMFLKRAFEMQISFGFSSVPPFTSASLTSSNLIMLHSPSQQGPSSSEFKGTKLDFFRAEPQYFRILLPKMKNQITINDPNLAPEKVFHVHHIPPPPPLDPTPSYHVCTPRKYLPLFSSSRVYAFSHYMNLFFWRNPSFPSPPSLSSRSST